jgi:cell wall-associated NlpC family hydrolase
LGGASPEDGFDCLGYLRYFYSALGYTVPSESDGISSSDSLAAYEADPARCKRALWHALLTFGDRIEVKFKQLGDLLVFRDDSDEPTSGIWVGRGNVLSCDARIGVAVFPARQIKSQRIEVIRPCLR